MTDIQCFFLSAEEKHGLHVQWQKRIESFKPGSPEYLKLAVEQEPVGSIFYCPWYWDHTQGKMPWTDKKYLSKHYATISDQRDPIMVVTPGGPWCPDSKSSSGTGWIVTGKMPTFTARPSIGIGQNGGGYKYHGFLTEGVLKSV